MAVSRVLLKNTISKPKAVKIFHKIFQTQRHPKPIYILCLNPQAFPILNPS